MAQELQQQRFELKYLIKEETALAMRDFVRCYLELDDYGVGKPGLRYPVHSLYLDSADLWTHHITVNGTKNRFKLRLRYYDDKPNTPVFFEVKARVDNCILKQRCGVRREAVALLLAGQLPEPDQLFTKDPRHLAALQRFNFRLLRLNAKPKLHNHYMREAWVSPHDNSVRVTFDRNILVEPFFESKATVEMHQPVQIYPGFVVLELKFTTRYPNWFKQMVRHFHLMQFSSAKYCGGIEALGEHCFHDGNKSLDWQRQLPYELRPQHLSVEALACIED